jgi:hypothetical protein
MTDTAVSPVAVEVDQWLWFHGGNLHQSRHYSL